MSAPSSHLHPRGRGARWVLAILLLMVLLNTVGSFLASEPHPNPAETSFPARSNSHPLDAAGP